jgi:structural maintenance of chromosome 2|eukprot:g5290.t1
MHIKQVILDGFKSYARRTVVGPFDKRFNAITGLNGSGKSNVLDSICFVLGISKLAQVRVESLQGLVYKNGQAGITKASVTIVFDNSDPKGSPIGYEDFKEITVCRQIVIGGKNKYMINGHNAQQKQVQTMFHSVGLNIHNPHFLIMQGRITKVLNMNPQEILGLLEEAAGTRMFEDKKNASVRTMGKKEDKVKEIDRILMEDITPNMKKLKDQRDQYQEWSKNNQQFKRDERFVIAFDYSLAVEALEEKKVEREQITVLLSAVQEKIRGLNEKMDETREKIQQLTAKRDEEIEGDFKKLTKQEEDFSKELVKANTVWKNQLATLEKEETSLLEQKQVAEDNLKAVEAATQKLESSKEAEVSAGMAVKEKQAQVDEAERQLQALSAGMAETEGQTSSLAEQLSVAEQEASDAATTVKVCEKQIKHARKEADTNTKALAKEQKQGSSLTVELEKKTKLVTKLEAEVSGSGFDEARENELMDQLEKDEHEASILREKVDNMWSRVENRLAFNYSTPYKKFDRSSVKGVVANLLSVKSPEYSTALEVTAGGKLYNVVVDTEATAKAVLQNGRLKKRVTIIPLNKIARKTLPAAKVKLAESMGEVTTAINLVGYPEEVEAAMAHVFGTTLVCRDAKTAEKVTFNDAIRLKTVTIEGDVYDPAGTLSGGSRASQQSILHHITALNEMRQKLSALDTGITANRQELKKLSAMNKKFAAKAQQLEVESHKLQILKERLGHSKLGQLQSRQGELEAALSKAQSELDEAKEHGQAAKERATSLKREIQEFNAVREKKMKEKESAIKSFKAELKAATKVFGKAQDQVQRVTIEIEQLKADMAETEEQVQNQQEEITQMREKVTEMESTVEERKKSYEEARVQVEEKKAALAECDRELKSNMKSLNANDKALEKLNMEQNGHEHKLKGFDRDFEKVTARVKAMEGTYNWIETEKEFFGEIGSDYDFEARNARKVKQNMAELKATQEMLEKKINRKVMGMIERAEKEYKELIAKKRSLSDDKHKIEDVISSLDVKKKTAIEKTWEQVTKDFGSIFSTLLPGTTAKLEPMEGKSVIDGVQVRVAFSGVWKDSLSELSGGQRSLVALSLILALLRFKPAPMYILDEVDAALDLSHTQNIGIMLRKHFTNSQFVVVSLKEGMFNNANCLFRTKFVDGMSTVRRTTPLDQSEKEEQARDAAKAKALQAKSAKKKKKSRRPLQSSN